MTQIADDPVAAKTVSFTLSRKVAGDIVNCSPHLADRMHHLLERNTDGLLNPTELAELEALVDLSLVKQLLAMAMDEQATA